MLGEMVFGSVAMAFQGSMLKVHSIRTPQQLMMTTVCPAPRPDYVAATGCEDQSSVLQRSDSDFINTSESSSTPGLPHSRTAPMSVPLARRNRNEDGDSGLSASLASVTSFNSMVSFLEETSTSNISTNTYNTLHRRWMRCQNTSLEFGLRRSKSRELQGSTEQLPPTQRSRTKLGIAVVVTLVDGNENNDNNDFQKFFFSHAPLMEGHVYKLRAAVEKAYLNKKEFLPIVIEALDELRDSLHDLYMSQRLAHPVWLTMMSGSTRRVLVCDQFMMDLMTLYEKLDNKNMHFFLSTLLTAVLSSHLAWVPTVSPADSKPSKTYLDKHSARWIDLLAKSHPYNPLWAQLGDLCGSVSQPCKLSRTVIVGKKADIIHKLLFILTYFIRCSEVFEMKLNDRELKSRSRVLSGSSINSACCRSLGSVCGSPDSTRAHLKGANRCKHRQRQGSTGSSRMYQDYVGSPASNISPYRTDVSRIRPNDGQQYQGLSGSLIGRAKVDVNEYGDFTGDNVNANVPGRCQEKTGSGLTSTYVNRNKDIRGLNTSPNTGMKHVESEKIIFHSGNTDLYLNEIVLTSSLSPDAKCSVASSSGSRTTSPSNAVDNITDGSFPRSTWYVRLDSEYVTDEPNDLRNSPKQKNAASADTVLEHKINSENQSQDLCSAQESGSSEDPKKSQRFVPSEHPNDPAHGLFHQDLELRGETLDSNYIGIKTTSNENQQDSRDFTKSTNIFESKCVSTSSPDVFHQVSTSDDAINAPCEIVPQEKFPEMHQPSRQLARHVGSDTTLTRVPLEKRARDCSTSSVPKGLALLSFNARCQPRRIVNHVRLQNGDILNSDSVGVATEQDNRSSVKKIDYVSSKNETDNKHLKYIRLPSKDRSFLDEYFEEDVETKTIDDIDEVSQVRSNFTAGEVKVFGKDECASRQMVEPVVASCFNLSSISSPDKQKRIYQILLELEKGNTVLLTIEDLLEIELIPCPELRQRLENLMKKNPLIHLPAKTKDNSEKLEVDNANKALSDKAHIGDTRSNDGRISTGDISGQKRSVVKHHSLPCNIPVIGNAKEAKNDSTKGHRGSLDGHTLFGTARDLLHFPLQSNSLLSLPLGQGDGSTSSSSRVCHQRGTSTCSDISRVFDLTMELPLPRCEHLPVTSEQTSLGWSLLGGYTTRYVCDFVLQGTTDVKFREKLLRDLSHAAQHPVVDEPVLEAVAVVADTDKWSVTHLECSSQAPDSIHETPMVFSRLVADMLESVYELWKLQLPVEFCLMHLEDRLQELYFKSRLVVEFLKSRNYINLPEVAAALGYSEGDLPLLIAIASTHSPHITIGI